MKNKFKFYCPTCGNVCVTRRDRINELCNCGKGFLSKLKKGSDHIPFCDPT